MLLPSLPKGKYVSLDCSILLLNGLILLFLSSCIHSTNGNTSKSKQKVLPVSFVDSLVQSVGSIDSLDLLMESYISSDNVYGEMSTRKALGDLYQQNSDYMKAIDEFNRSLVLAEKLHDTLYIIKNHNELGASLRFLGITAQSVENFFQALVISDKWSKKDLDVAQAELVKSHVGIGHAQLTLENYDRAETALRLALSLEEKRENKSGEAEIYANLGKIREKIGQPDSAFFYYERSLELNRYVNSKRGIAVCYNHFGRLAEAKGDLDAALRYYYRANYIIDNGPVNETVMESCLSMARVYLKRKDMQNAQHFIQEGWNMAVQSRSWKMMSQACLLQSRYDELKGNVKQSLHWFKMSVAYNDSVTNDRTRMFVQKIRQQYVSDKYNKELDTLRENYTRVRNDNRAFLVWAVLAGIFALLCIVFLLFILRVRLRSQQMMQHMEKVRTDFFTNITHEFRTPLTVMLGLGRQIYEQNGPAEERDYQKMGEMIVRQGYSLLDLVNQLLDIARAETEIDKTAWRRGNILPYLSMIIENCQVYAEQQNVLLVFASSERDLVIDFVPEYIRKVLQNLVTNAVKYSGDGGKVTVQMRRRGHNMNLVVSDTGKGVPEKDLTHIFDAFYTATNWGIEVSTGVGLAMVKQMIISMHGKISVESTLGKGTTFYIDLPLRQGLKKIAALETDFFNSMGKEYVPNLVVNKAVAPKDELEDTLKPTVLVIEDNRDVATYMGMQLSGRYRVAYATNGREGVAKAENLVPDLIVTDLMMPLMDGYEVCREIRLSESLHDIPIIIVSAKSTEDDKLKGLEAGADAYLFKPFNAEELRLKVANLIEQRKMMRLKYSSTSVEQSETNSSLKPFEREFLNKFVDLVYSQMYRGNIDAESLASFMCMSSSQLRRRIFAITGEKLTTYVLQLRLKRAKQLLDSQGDMPVADVASRCGFEDAAYFSRTFKNVYQMTPSQYRRQCH